MKKTLLFAIALFFIAGTVYSQTTDKVRKWFIEGGVSSYLQSEGSCAGFLISGGYYITSHNRLSLDISMHPRSKKIGDYSYTITTTQGGTVTDRTTYHDGVISRDYSTLPVLVSWRHERNLSDKFMIRAGASVGLTTLSAQDSYSPTTKNGVKIQGIPENKNEKESVSFTGGLGVGLAWNLFKFSGLALNYNLLFNEGGQVETLQIGTISNQLQLSYWWKF